MSSHDDSRTGQTPAAPSAARRALLTAGAAMGAGAAGVLLAPSASAAAGSTMKAGSTNDGGSSTTTVTSSSTSATLKVVAKAKGYALRVEGHKDGHAILTYSPGPEKFGVFSSNTATSTGDVGGAVRAKGHKNPGLVADTDDDVTDVPAITATGGNGAGVALLATGDSYLDGSAFALRSYVGALASDGQTLDYVPLVSADKAVHQRTGTATLSGGSATVDLGTAFRQAVGGDLTGLVVLLTAQGTAIPNLRFSLTSSGFTISGGSGSEKVCWMAIGTRTVLEFSAAQVASAATAGQARETAVVDRPVSGARRVVRRLLGGRR